MAIPAMRLSCRKQDADRPMLDAFLYEILEVSPTARAAVIRAAYRCLSRNTTPTGIPAILRPPRACR